jgi:hypothetical protein
MSQALVYLFIYPCAMQIVSQEFALDRVALFHRRLALITPLITPPLTTSALSCCPELTCPRSPLPT